MKLIALLFSMLATSAWAADAPDEQNGNHLLVGKWTWTRSVNQCTEVYEYRPDGTLQVVSGEERSDNTYNLSAKPTSKGFHRLAVKVVKDHGGKDCGNTSDDETGSTYNAYVMFHPSGDGHVVCKEESFDSCFGPLRRLPK